MDELAAGFDHADEPTAMDVASHDDHGGLGDSGSLGSSLLDDAPHDPADAVSTVDHAPADHVPAEPAATHHEPAHHEPAHHNPASDTAAHEQPAAHDPQPGSDMQMNIDGIQYDAGRIDVDLDHDGHADSSVLHTVRDGVEQNEYYTDNNGDGRADELTITDHNGALISHTEFDSHTDQWVETPLDHALPAELPDQ